MSKPLKLNPFIGSKRTLVISTSSVAFERFTAFDENIFVHVVGGGRLLRYDPQQREILQEHIEGKFCSQIIFVGSRDEEFIEQIQTDDALYSLKSALAFDLKPLVNGRLDQLIDPVVKVQMLIELNVISQCRLLMDYFFIREKVESNKLQVKGVVTDVENDRLKSIFRNGIVYNDLLTLN